MALVEQFYQWKINEYSYIKNKTEEYNKVLGQINPENLNIKKYRGRYESFISLQNKILETLIIDEKPEHHELNLKNLIKYQFVELESENIFEVELQLLVGGLDYLVKNKTSRDLMFLTAVFSLSECPVTCIPKLFTLIEPSGKETILKVFQCWLDDNSSNRLSFKLKVSAEGYGTWEEKLLNIYNEGLKEENLDKVEQFMKSWRMGHRRTHNNFIYSLMGLAYYTDKELFLKIALIEDQPVMINSILDYFFCSFDLPLLYGLVLKGKSWTGIEVLLHLLNLLRVMDRHERFETLARFQFNAFKRLLVIFIGRVLTLMVQEQKGKITYFLERITTGANNANPCVLTYWGKCVAKGLKSREESTSLEEEVADWQPYWQSDNLKFALKGLQEHLISENKILAIQLNKSILKIWFRYVIAQYKNKIKNSSLPFTCLDWAVSVALQQRWQTKERSMIFLKGVLRRLRSVETQWFENIIEESRKRQAIYALLMAHAFSWVNLSSTEINRVDIKTIQKVLQYMSDERRWEKEYGSSRSKPHYFKEIERAYTVEPFLA